MAVGVVRLDLHYLVVVHPQHRHGHARLPLVPDGRHRARPKPYKSAVRVPSSRPVGDAYIPEVPNVGSAGVPNGHNKKLKNNKKGEIDEKKKIRKKKKKKKKEKKKKISNNDVL